MADSIRPDEEVAFNDPRVQIMSMDRYKGEKGRTDLLAFISSGVMQSFSHYAENGDSKKRFRCLSNPTTRAICCESLGEPDQRFGLAVFHYLTDRDGALVDVNTCRGTPKIWIISEARFKVFKSLAAKWPIMDAGFDKPQHDLLIKCTNDRFQNMEFNPDPSCQWKKKENWYKALKVRAEGAKGTIRKALGDTLSLAEVQQLLATGSRAVATAPGGTENADDLDLGDVLDNAAG